MTSRTIEVLPAGSALTSTPDIALEWPAKPSDHTDIKASMLWNLESFARANAPARDLTRIVAAAFLADSRVAKPQVSLHRDLTIRVHVEDIGPWDGAMRSKLADLLHWLTGDSWTLEVAPSAAPVTSAPHSILTSDRVQLLSGGLDSLCGAVASLRDSTNIAFLGLRDSNNAVRHAQDTIATALGQNATYYREELFLERSAIRKNHGPRSRSLFYMAVGVMLAEELSAGEVWVPENGFTSINPPLTDARGGALTTRSTHPTTFMLVGEVLRGLGINVAVGNPYGGLTKGELVRLAGADLVSGRWMDATATSYSCGAGNAQLHGASPNQNCGLCVACVVRRGSFLAGGISDPTSYAVDVLSGRHRAGLIDVRSKDVVAIKSVLAAGLDEDEILSSGTWPPGTDFDAIVDLVGRGVEELRGVRLPST